MATRNERKRLAKARKAQLTVAINEAFKAEFDRQAPKRRLDALRAEYPCDMDAQKGRTVGGRTVDRRGIIQRGKFVKRDAPQPYVSPETGGAGRGENRKPY